MCSVISKTVPFVINNLAFLNDVGYGCCGNNVNEGPVLLQQVRTLLARILFGHLIGLKKYATNSFANHFLVSLA